MLRRIVSVSFLFAIAIGMSAMAAPASKMRQPLDTRGHVVLPLHELLYDDGAHDVTVAVILDGKQIFEEKYSVRMKQRASVALQLNLQGAGAAELQQIASAANSRCLFRVAVDGVEFASLSAAALLDLSHHMQSAPRAVLSQVQPSLSYNKLTITPPADGEQHPLPESTRLTISQTTPVKPAGKARAGTALKPRTNYTVLCPSVATGGCSPWENCSGYPGYCDPYDSGWDQCVAECQSYYDSCAFGEPATVQEFDWFEPQVYYGQVAGFEHWYCFLTGCGTWLGNWVPVWEIFYGVHHHMTRTTYNCMLDGPFGPYTEESSYQDICLIKTSLRVAYGEYLGDACLIE